MKIKQQQIYRFFKNLQVYFFNNFYIRIKPEELDTNLILYECFNKYFVYDTLLNEKNEYIYQKEYLLSNVEKLCDKIYDINIIDEKHKDEIVEYIQEQKHKFLN